jgi:hypothetical protein
MAEQPKADVPKKDSPFLLSSAADQLTLLLRLLDQCEGDVDPLSISFKEEIEKFRISLKLVLDSLLAQSRSPFRAAT